jgi:hypothetical protein
VNAPCLPLTLPPIHERPAVKRADPLDLQLDSAVHDRCAGAPTGWQPEDTLGAGLPERERALYVRYVRALALLCECAPYVDEPDYADMIDDVLAEACRHYPLAWQSDGERREIAVRAPAPD